MPNQFSIRNGLPLRTSFTANYSGTLSEIYLGHVLDSNLASSGNKLNLSVSGLPNGALPLGAGTLRLLSSQDAQTEGFGFVIDLDSDIPLQKDNTYYLTFFDPLGNKTWDLCGAFTAFLQVDQSLEEIPLAVPETCTLPAGGSLSMSFQAPEDANLMEIYLSKANTEAAPAGEKTLQVGVSSGAPNAGVPNADDQNPSTATGGLTGKFTEGEPGYGDGYLVKLDQPLQIEKGRVYNLTAALVGGVGDLSLRGSAVANEGEWDDSLPLRLDGYDPFGGLYTHDLNFNMYWDDNLDKLERFSKILDEAEYVVISSNRQWGTLPRLPERFPMSTTYYRNLLGCPAEKTIEWCYRVAKRMFNGSLGLTGRNIPIRSKNQRINTQFADEASLRPSALT
jgi:hypothetical protein